VPSNSYDEISDGTDAKFSLCSNMDVESVQSPTLHTDLGIDRNELIRRLKQNIQSGQQDGYPLNRNVSPLGSNRVSVPTTPRPETPARLSNRPLQFGVFTDAATLQNHQRPPSPHPFPRSPPASPILSLSSPIPPRGYDPTTPTSRVPSTSSRRLPSFSSPLARPAVPDRTPTRPSEPIDISPPSQSCDSATSTSHRPVKSYAGLGTSQGLTHRARSRRMSSVGTITSELFGSFVGSYEESIVNGRMSTTPSKPVTFIAQIGVLSLHASTPARLRCPPHLSLPFPAVFYSVQDYDSPSPYVGQLDIPAAIAAKRLNSPKSKPLPVEGYRIPQKGQIQIIIKNPNKTAVKLFLIPYDLEQMPPYTKTFIRQKSYVDNILRYAVHIQICSPCPHKYFIFGSVRVVFANRVPETSEKLRVENLYPDQLEVVGGRWAKWESQTAYAARMRRYSSVKEKSEWNGETLEREVMMGSSNAVASDTRKGKDKNLKENRRVLSPQVKKLTPQLSKNVVSGTKSTVPKRTEPVEPGLLALKLRELDLNKDNSRA
jgi:Domain of unknown function (DUF4210)/Chromosome segregation during meiosis